MARIVKTVLCVRFESHDPRYYNMKLCVHCSPEGVLQFPPVFPIPAERPRASPCLCSDLSMTGIFILLWLVYIFSHSSIFVNIQTWRDVGVCYRRTKKTKFAFPRIGLQFGFLTFHSCGVAHFVAIFV